MKNAVIEIKGAKSHNLKNISLSIKKNKITCLAGPSGSGKSSLAYHTLYAESKRRFLNSISNNEKFFWDIPKTADVESIDPILPVWALAQYNPVMGSRFNVSDILQITEALQSLVFHGGKSYCPKCEVPLEKNSFASQIKNQCKGQDEKEVLYLFVSYGEYNRLFPDQFPSKVWNKTQGTLNYGREEIDQDEDNYALYKRVKLKNIESFLEQIKIEEKNLFEVFFKIGEGNLLALKKKKKLNCPSCNYSREEIDDIRMLSPINALGACSECDGHGGTLEIDPNKVVRENNKSIAEGAIHVLNYVHFQHFLPELIKVLKKNGYDPYSPFSELDEGVWDIIENDQGKYPGTNQLFEYLESKKYKKSVRIYLRGFKSEYECQSCEGTRINSSCLELMLPEKKGLLSYKNILGLNLIELRDFLKDVESTHPEVAKLKKLLEPTLELAIDLGVEHLGLTRKLKSISGSEYQRLLLVKYMRHETSDGFYILDEPSLGLNLKYQMKILTHLKTLAKEKTQFF